MQLFALENNKSIFIGQAQKRKNYICPDCGQPLRVRGGICKRSHFYHVNRKRYCRQSNKSKRHLKLQQALQKIFPPNDVRLEMIFLKILRIADVVWLSRKIIFEIQCSRITISEVQKRVSDYESLGYTVIWILDDHLFNRKKCLKDEYFLRTKQCYFAKLLKDQILIYDQFEVIHKEKRLYQSRNIFVRINRPFLIKDTALPKYLPPQILSRIESHKLYFSRDITDIFIKNPSMAHFKMYPIMRKKIYPMRKKFFQFFKSAYLGLLELLIG